MYYTNVQMKRVIAKLELATKRTSMFKKTGFIVQEPIEEAITILHQNSVPVVCGRCDTELEISFDGKEMLISPCSVCFGAEGEKVLASAKRSQELENTYNELEAEEAREFNRRNHRGY